MNISKKKKMVGAPPSRGRFSELCDVLKTLEPGEAVVVTPEPSDRDAINGWRNIANSTVTSIFGCGVFGTRLTPENNVEFYRK